MQMEASQEMLVRKIFKEVLFSFYDCPLLRYYCSEMSRSHKKPEKQLIYNQKFSSNSTGP
jgi:hypothetical protein